MTDDEKKVEEEKKAAEETKAAEEKAAVEKKAAEDKPTISQSQLDAIIKDRLEQQDRKHKSETEKSQKDAEETKLVEQKEFEKLATDRDVAIKELEPKLATAVSELETSNEKVKALEATLGERLDAEKKALGLDDKMLELMNDKPIEEQLAWLNKHGESLRKAGPRGPGSLPNEEMKPGDMSVEERRAKTAKTF